jgi:hypothetical protein
VATESLADLAEVLGGEVVIVGLDDRGHEGVMDRLAIQMRDFPSGFGHLAIQLIPAAAVEIPAGIETGFEIVEHTRVVEVFRKIKLALVQLFKQIGRGSIAP